MTISHKDIREALRVIALCEQDVMPVTADSKITSVLKDWGYFHSAKLRLERMPTSVVELLYLTYGELSTAPRCTTLLLSGQIGSRVPESPLYFKWRLTDSDLLLYGSFARALRQLALRNEDAITRVVQQWS